MSEYRCIRYNEEDKTMLMHYPATKCFSIVDRYVTGVCGATKRNNKRNYSSVTSDERFPFVVFASN